MSRAAPGAAPVAVVGAGAWGTALAVILGARYPDVLLWVYETDLAGEMKRARENRVYLSGVRLPAAARPTNALETLADRTLVVIAVPSHAFRSVPEQCRPYLHPDALIVSATKGLEVGTLKIMSQAEMMRLGTALGARPRTLAGPAGTGDLILTCTSDLSRNRRLGLAIAAGTRLEEHLASSRSVAEGATPAAPPSCSRECTGWRCRSAKPSTGFFSGGRRHSRSCLS